VAPFPRRVTASNKHLVLHTRFQLTLKESTINDCENSLLL
jgi:hypothetical protein